MVRVKSNKISPINNFNSESFSKSINSIRAIAIIIIIISHSSSLKFNLYIKNRFYYAMGAIGVALFTFLSGVLLARAILIKEEKNHSWNKWFKKRIIRIFPLLILTTLFILLYQFVFFNNLFDLNSILIHMSGFQAIPTNPNILLIMDPHWFITFILSCYIIFPSLYYFLKTRFKLVVIIGLTIYFIFLIFNETFYLGIEYFFSDILHKEFKINFFRGYFPGYFTFFFGMILGYKLGNDDSFKMNLLKYNIYKLGSFFILLFLCLLSMYLNDLDGMTIFSPYNFLYIIIIFPLITIFLTIFFIIYLNNKPIINKYFKVLGNHSYEVYLIHVIPITLLSLLEIELELYFLYILIAVVGNIALSHPFYYVGNLLQKKRKYHDVVITISLSLMIYALIVYLFQLEINFNNLGALTLFLSILISMSTVFILKRYFNSNITTYI